MDDKPTLRLDAGRKDAKIIKEKYFGIRQDIFAWSIGIVFIVSLIAAIMGFGHVRNWDAQSGYTHNISQTSSVRFLSEPAGDEKGIPGRCDSTAAGRWYYWKIPPDQTTALTRAIVWLCYTLHQLFIWGSIYFTQRMKTRSQTKSGPKYSNTMTLYQWIPLFINMIFHLLHLGHTHWLYDATAQDVSEASSQSSVIMLLVFILLLEYRDRGLFFGWPSIRHQDRMSKYLRLNQGPTDLIRKYHGYAFAWGAIYTFWYHPMENTWGHCMGFVHTWLLMLQGSLFYTNFHLNRYWRLLLEFWVTMHATVVAVQTGGPSNDMWKMFCFGFLWMFFMTQLFGLAIWKKLPWWAKPVPFLIYFAICIGLYGFYFVDSKGRYWIGLNEVIRIPLIEYGAVFWSWMCLWAFLKIEKCFNGGSSQNTQKPINMIMEVIYIFICIFIYSLLVVISYLIQKRDLKVGLTSLMISLVMLFILLVSISIMFMKQIMRPLKRESVMISRVSTGIEIKPQSLEMAPATSIGNNNGYIGNE